VFLPHPARVVAVFDVVLEVGVVVDLVEGVFLLLFLRLDFLRFFRFVLGLGLFGLRLFGLRLLGGFIEERILEELLVQDFLELELRELQQLDRLLQRRRHDQLLAEFEVKLLFKCHDRESVRPNAFLAQFRLNVSPR
jgi:hypothetical protein